MGGSGCGYRRIPGGGRDRVGVRISADTWGRIGWEWGAVSENNWGREGSGGVGAGTGAGVRAPPVWKNAALFLALF